MLHLYQMVVLSPRWEFYIFCLWVMRVRFDLVLFFALKRRNLISNGNLISDYSRSDYSHRISTDKLIFSTDYFTCFRSVQNIFLAYFLSVRKSSWSEYVFSNAPPPRFIRWSYSFLVQTVTAILDQSNDMGTGGSKYPDWYPGEPDPAFYSFKGRCSCGREEVSSSEASDGVRFPAPSRANIKRQIELLPVVELTDWKVGPRRGASRACFLCCYRGTVCLLWHR